MLFAEGTGKVMPESCGDLPAENYYLGQCHDGGHCEPHQAQLPGREKRFCSNMCPEKPLQVDLAPSIN